jgi:hypothetical protein
MARLIHHPGR